MKTSNYKIRCMSSGRHFDHLLKCMLTHQISNHQLIYFPGYYHFCINIRSQKSDTQSRVFECYHRWDLGGGFTQATWYWELGVLKIIRCVLSKMLSACRLNTNFSVAVSTHWTETLRNRTVERLRTAEWWKNVARDCAFPVLSDCFSSFCPPEPSSRPVA